MIKQSPLLLIEPKVVGVSLTRLRPLIPRDRRWRSWGFDVIDNRRNRIWVNAVVLASADQRFFRHVNLQSARSRVPVFQLSLCSLSISQPLSQRLVPPDTHDAHE